MLKIYHIQYELWELMNKKRINKYMNNKFF